ncbi:hypothetical protein HK102_006986 [Quaeritorhiza haematococci]|nr:hypothetical protein HK102_006986 [Quaeritorhiza haematococci]
MDVFDTEEDFNRHTLAREAEMQRKIAQVLTPIPNPTQSNIISLDDDDDGDGDDTQQKTKLITIKIRNMEEIMKVKAVPSTTIRDVLATYLQRKGGDGGGGPAAGITLVFDGDALSMDETLEDAGVEDDDMLECRFSRV